VIARPAGPLRLAPLIALLLASVIVPFLLIGGEVERLAAAWISKSSGTLAVFCIVVGLLAADILLPIPSSIVATMAGVALGWATGAAAVFIGLMLASVAGYFGGRVAGPFLVRHVAGPDEQARVERWVSRYGAVAVAASRAVPVLAESIAIAAGAGKMAITKFLWASTAANLGLAIVYAGFGALAAQEAQPSIAIGASLVLPAIAWLLARRVHARALAYPRR
jgi:membrane protein DedA with SNARE-associated domain